MPESNSSWTDKAKAFAIFAAVVLMFLIAWQQKFLRPKVSPEERAATEAMKTKISEQAKNYAALKAEKEKKITDIEKEKTLATEKAGKLEKKLMSREKYYAEILKAKQTGDYEEIIRQADVCYQSREAEIKLRESTEKELAEVRTLYKKSDEIVMSLNEQMRIQLQATQDCQEKKSKGSLLVWGLFGGYDPFTGRMTAGIGAMLALGEL